MNWLNKIKDITIRLPKKEESKPEVALKKAVDKVTVDAKEAEKKPAHTKKVGTKAAQYLMHPVISEKAAHLAEAGRYMFEVSGNANKVEIKKAIEELYGVKPDAVNIMNMMGKRVVWGRRSGKRKNWKRAIVTLPKGKTLDVYEGV